MQKRSEGPSVPAKAKQGPDIQDFKTWVEASVWTDRMLAALVNGVKGGKWFSLVDKVYRMETLEAAWTQVKSRKGCAGCDGVSIQRFSAHADKYLEEIATTLRNGVYKPSPIKRVWIEKASGGLRPLGIPTVKDRIVQTAVKFVLEPILEKEFRSCSFGFRPKRNAKDALREVDGHLRSNHTVVVDIDIKDFFDTRGSLDIDEQIGGLH